MKVLKILLVIVVVLMLILAGGMFLLTRFLNTSEFKVEVLGVVREATGTDVRIGTMKVSLLRGIDLEDVSIANPPGYGGNLLTAKSFALHYRLLPLLQKRVVIETLSLDTPVITLTKNSEGGWNYEKISVSAEPKTTAPKPAEPKPASSGGRGLKVTVSQIDLKNATIIMRDDSGKELLRIANASFSSSVDLSGGQLTGKGHASIAEAVAANSLFIRQVAAPVSITADGIKLAPLTGKVADGEIIGEAGLAGSKYSVNLNVKDADIVKLIQEAGVAKRVFSSGRLQVNTTLAGTGGLSTMTGSGKIEITGGQLVDIPVLNVVGALLQVPVLQSLKFDECVVEYAISNNVMTTPVVRLKSPQVQITGHGTVTLDDYALKHTLTLALAKDALDRAPKEARNLFSERPDGLLALDFKVWGPYDKPKTDLDKRLLKGIGEQLLPQLFK